MKLKTNKMTHTLSIVLCLMFCYGIWQSLRPVNIIAIHHKNDDFTSVLVKNFPFTDKGKIAWWLKNKDRLKENHGIPASDKDGFFEVIFWDFNDGYQETDGYDRLCFEDISPPLNCIEKDKLLTISNDRENNIYFGVNDGEYKFEENGEMVKTKY